MSDKSFDYKKEYKDLYLPKRKPALIEIPPINFVMADGEADPNNNPAFQQATELLYGICFTIKMSKMKGNQPKGYFEYVVPPLEGLWWIDEGGFSFEQRDNWKWTLMIRQPEFVDQEVFAWSLRELAKKKPDLNLAKIRFESFNEGLCVQMMHIGPYSTEPETMQIIENYIEQNGLADRVGIDGKHHEIYLSDPRKSNQQTLKTVLRHPVVYL